MSVASTPSGHEECSTLAGSSGASDLKLIEWAPRSQLVTTCSPVTQACVPAIDVHNHLGRWLTADWCAPDVGALLDLMDQTNLQTVVNLDGLWGAELAANLERYDLAHPGRFITFCQVNWDLLSEPDGARVISSQLRESVDCGARGLKVWKNLGLEVVDGSGSLVMPDDPAVVEILTLAGELGVPVLVHFADPKAFFDPIDTHNERFDELIQVPQWSRADRTRYPSFDRLLDAFETLLAAIPDTVVIGAHVGCAAEDLDRVDRLLTAAPNLVIDIAGRLAELGRQPRRFSRLVRDHPDRILFGTDAYPLDRNSLETYFRFLETADESFAYSPDDEIPPQGRWAISGADLTPALLPGLYADNARRVLGLADPC